MQLQTTVFNYTYLGKITNVYKIVQVLKQFDLVLYDIYKDKK